MIDSNLENLNLQEQIDFITERIYKIRQLKTIIHKTKTSNDLWNAKLDYQIKYYKGLLKQFKLSDKI